MEKITLRLTWKHIRADLARYRATDGWSYPAIFVLCPGAPRRHLLPHWPLALAV
ncbi:MAG: hypothetical protein HC828_13115 [Blastochloris sp.]|nr:hypothetical protein [Blastochloris sp.]